MKRNLGWSVCTMAVFSLSAMHAQEALPLQKVQDVPIFQDSQVSGKRLWQASVITLSVANVLDVHSSLGKRELNSALAGPSGTLGTRGILLKSGLQGGLLGIEYLIIRSHSHHFEPNQSRSKLYRTLAIVNFASSAVLTGFAARNYTIPRPNTQP